MLTFLLLACDGTKDTGNLEPNITLEDANNYSFSGSISITSVNVAPLTDLTFDWSALTEDIQCHEVVPSEMKNSAVLRFANLSQAEVTTKINNNSLVQADLTNYVDKHNDAAASTSILSDMTFFGTDVDAETFTTPDAGTFLAIVSDSIEQGVGVKSLVFFAPTEGETNTTVSFPDPCGSLDYTVDLDALSKLSVEVSDYNVLDWAPLTVDAAGVLFEDPDIDEVLVGWYETETAADLETQFLDLELLPEKMWSMTVSNTTEADLSMLQGLSGTTDAFTGFSSDGLWIVALNCTTCPNPAPKFLTIVEAK